MAKPDEHELLRAATHALDELGRRDRDTLEQAVLDNRTIDEIARASLISIERAAFWMEGARTQFRDKLAHLLGVELSPTEVHDALAAALRHHRRPATVVIGPIDPIGEVTCPGCGVRFHDRDGQLAAYGKLAREGRIGLLVGCGGCSLLFVP